MRTTVEGENLAGSVRHFHMEKADEARDIGDRIESSQSVCATEPGAKFVTEVSGHFGLKESWQHTVHADTSCAVFAGK